MAAKMGADCGRVAVVAGVGLGATADLHLFGHEISPDRAKLMAQGAIALIDIIRCAGDDQGHFAAMAGAGVGGICHAGKDNERTGYGQSHLDFSTVTPAKAGAYTRCNNRKKHKHLCEPPYTEAYGSRR